MGRAHEVRAASMAATAAKKTKIYSRYGKEIYMAAKGGVPDPNMNQTLKRVIEKAKAAQVPADVIKRNIEKAKGNNAEAYIENRYEGFGPSGSTIIIDTLSDNSNRTLAEVQEVKVVSTKLIVIWEKLDVFLINMITLDFCHLKEMKKKFWIS